MEGCGSSANTGSGNFFESGEMDIDRSAVCVAWWGSRGGRDQVLFGRKEEGPFMSGGLGKRESSL